MPTLQSHTHCQAAQANRTSQSLSKSVSFPTHGRKESTGIQSNSPPCQQALTGRGFHTTVRTVHVYSGSLRNGAIF